jgi:predicted DNA binding CopG/RHH family protein
MKDEYDFSKGERGKFYRPDAEHHVPLYLDSDVLEFLTRRARAQGMEPQELANEMLKKDIARAQDAERRHK